MRPRDDASLRDAWIALQGAEYGSPEFERAFWAFERLQGLIETEPEETLAFVLAVLAHDRSEVVMSSLARGPLQDLLTRYPDRMIDAVEARALADPHFARLLGGVSRPRDVWHRIEEAAGKRWRPGSGPPLPRDRWLAARADVLAHRRATDLAWAAFRFDRGLPPTHHTVAGNGWTRSFIREGETWRVRIMRTAFPMKAADVAATVMVDDRTGACTVTFNPDFVWDDEAVAEREPPDVPCPCCGGAYEPEQPTPCP